MANPIKLSELFDAEDGAKEILDIAQGLAQLSKNYKQFAKNIDGDSQKVATALGSLTTQTTALRTAMAGVNVSADQERTGYAALSAQLQQLFQEQQRLLAAQAGIDNTRKNTTQGVRVLTSELGLQQKALREAYAAGNTEGIKAAALEILKLKANSEDLNRALRGANSVYTAATGSYRAMENEARLLGTQLKALEGSMGSNSDEVRDLQKRLADVNAALISFGRGVNDGHANVGRYAESIIEAVGSLNKQRNALLADADALRSQAAATGLSREQQEKLQQELAQTDAQLRKVNTELQGYGVNVQHGGGATAAMGENVLALAQSFAGAYVGIQGVATAIQQVFEANIQYSDSIADVAKTTGLTIEQTNGLAESLKKVDTRTSLQGLLDIAGVGGQLGVAASDIEAFTKAIDISVQALGNDFTGGAEEIATSLGKINTVFGKQLGTDLSENLLHIGSALNQLGAVGAATAPQLADVALRTGAVAANAGLGLDKVLSYATVLQEVGFSAEQSGTALNRLFGTLSTRTEASFKIAKLGDANLTLKEFKRLVNTDFEGAIQAFLKGLNAGGTTTTRFNQLLGTLKLQSGEAKSVITTLAKNVDLYRERLAVANQELQTGNSVAAEAAIKNETLGGSFAKLKNDVTNFFTDSTLGDFLKENIDATRERIELTVAGFHKLAEAVAYVKQKVGLAQPKELGGSDVQAANTKALYEQSVAAQKLVDRYISLQNVTGRTTAQQAEQSAIVRQLQAAFTSGVVAIDKDTQAVTLNVLAAQQAIDKKREQFDNQKQSFIDQISLSDSAITELQGKIDKQQQEVARQTQTLGANMGAAQIKEIREALLEQDKLRARFGDKAEAESTQGISSKDLKAVEAVTNAEKDLAAAEKQLQQEQAKRAQIANNLAGIAKLGAAATQDQTKKTLDDIDADKKKKQSTADVAKEEFELQKQRLQARIADLDRQADSPANTDTIRTAAVAKGVQARRELAVLERDEQIREVAQTNKDKINGDAATATARIRLTETYQTELLKITRDGDTKLVGLRNTLLNQLGELDKIELESEIAAAEKVRDNVNKTYDERQKAAREAAHAQIELAAIVRDTEIRNALGALDKIELANKRYEDARAKASASVKVYDSAKDIDEQSARYARLELAVEDSYGKQLLSQKNYDRQVRDLENRREADAIAALEAEYGETEEVLRRKLALRKKINGEELSEEKEKEQKRAEIVQAAVEKLQAVAGAYFDYQATKLQAAEQSEQTSYDNSIKAAGDNVALKNSIEASHAKKIAEIRQRQAENEREQAIFSITIATAMAVAKSLSQFGLPLAIPFMAADVIAGGLQLAAVLARPVPQYFRGRESGPAEYAELAERGPEIVGKPGSYRLLTTPTVGYLEQGDRVITAPKTRQLLMEHTLIDGHLLPQPAALPATEVVGGRAQYHREQADMYYQARTMQQQLVQSEARQQRLYQHSNDKLISKLEQVRRQIEEQGYRRWDELGQAMEEIKRGNSVQRMYDKRRYTSDWKRLLKGEL